MESVNEFMEMMANRVPTKVKLTCVACQNDAKIEKDKFEANGKLCNKCSDAMGWE